MEKNSHILLLVSLFSSFLVGAQELTPEIDVEESAEVFLEEYSDDFQENFFEALKQKGIENYDRAINLMLECKRIDATNRVVDHELAKLYLKEKHYALAEEHVMAAVTAVPENLWYANTLVEILLRQGKSLDSLKEELPFGYPKFNENLALIYFKKEAYQTALKLLQEADQSSFTKVLTSKINDSIKKQAASVESTSFSAENSNNDGPDSFNQYKNRILGLLQANNILLLEQVSTEALERFPSQPFFYYAQGYALSKSGKNREAVEVLETGLDYLIGDIALANKIYQELGNAYIALNNSVKANMYLRKIKSGF